MEPKNPKLINAADVLKKARENYLLNLESVVSVCPHDTLVECTYSNSYAPMRACCDCGLCEEGWGSGYQILHKTQDMARVERDVVYKLRTVTISETDRGPLLRRQLNVQELLSSKIRVAI